MIFPCDGRKERIMVIINEAGEVEIVLAAPEAAATEGAATETAGPEATPAGTSEGDEATPVPTYAQGNAFEVGENTDANTDKAGGVIMIIIIIACTALVIEGLISFIVKAKKRHDDGFM